MKSPLWIACLGLSCIGLVALITMGGCQPPPLEPPSYQTTISKPSNVSGGMTFEAPAEAMAETPGSEVNKEGATIEPQPIEPAKEEATKKETSETEASKGSAPQEEAAKVETPKEEAPKELPKSEEPK